MTLNPSVSVFVGDDKFTSNNVNGKNISQYPQYYEVPVHVILPQEMCAALNQNRNSRYLEDLQIRMDDDVYIVSGVNILEAKKSEQTTMKLNQSTYENMVDSSRQPVYNNLQVDLSYLLEAVSLPPEGDLKVPLIIRIPPSENDVSNFQVLTASEAESVKIRDVAFEEPDSEYSFTYTQFTPRSRPKSSNLIPLNNVLDNPNTSVANKAKFIIRQHDAIPDDVSGIENYRPPSGIRRRKKGYYNRPVSKLSSVRSYYSHIVPARPSSTYRYSDRASATESHYQPRTRYTNYSEPIYRTAVYPSNDSKYVDDGFDSISEHGKTFHSRDAFRRHLTKRRKALTITFYRNGDPNYPGFTTGINLHDFPTLETLLVWLSDKISLPYGVRYIYNLEGGEVQDIVDLEDGCSYVVASSQFVKNVHYGNSREGQWKLTKRKGSPGRLRRSDRNLYHENDEYQSRVSVERNSHSRKDYSLPAKGGKPRVITIINNIQRDKKAKILINPKTLQSFEGMLEDWSMVLKMSQIKKMYAASSNQLVQSYSQLFNDLNKEEIFVMCGRDTYKPNAPIVVTPSANHSVSPKKRQPVQHQNGPLDPAVEMMNLQPIIDEPQNIYLDGAAERRRLFQMNDLSSDDVISNDSKTQRTNYTYDNQLPADTIAIKIHGKPKTFFAPSDYSAELINHQQTKSLELEWVYGYRGFDSRLNLYFLQSGELIYFVGAVVVLYNKESEVQRHFLDHNEDVTCIAVHSSHEYAATGQKNGSLRSSPAFVCVWNIQTLEVIVRLGGNEFLGAVCTVNFSHNNDGELLLAIDGGEHHYLHLWNWQTGQKLSKTKTHPDTVVTGAFYPLDDQSMITCGKQHLFFWRMVNGKILRDKKSGVFKDEVPHYVTCIEFNSLGWVITGDSAGSITIWNKDDKMLFTVKYVILNAHEKSIFCLCVLSDNTLISGGGVDRRIISWDASQNYSTAKSGRQLPDTVGGIRHIVPLVDDNSKLIVGTTKNSVLKGSLQSKFSHIIQSHHGELWAMATHPSERSFFTAGFDQLLCLWDATNHQLLWKLVAENACLSASFHPCGSVIAVGTTSGKVVVINVSTGKVANTFNASTEQIDVLKFSPDGLLLATGCHDKQIHLFTVLDNGYTFRRYTSLSGHNSFITHLDWSHDCDYLQSVSANYNLLFWDVNKMRPEQAHIVRDVEWSTHSSVLGFAVSGVWSQLPKATDANTCARSDKQDALASGDTRGFLRMFKYPVVEISDAVDSTWTKICSTNVTQVNFTSDDTSLIAIGGPDACIFQYNVLDT